MVSSWLLQQIRLKSVHQLVKCNFVHFAIHLTISYKCRTADNLKSIGRQHKYESYAPRPTAETTCSQKTCSQTPYSPNGMLPKRHTPQTTYSPNDILPKRHTPQTTYSPNDITEKYIIQKNIIKTTLLSLTPQCYFCTCYLLSEIETTVYAKCFQQVNKGPIWLRRWNLLTPFL